ncbi:mitogen-activated protein kinase kinase kinase 20-like [Mercurialis annua]|uniref:mitogen-activated protein kinase kinase kinase 20-like n=1 Tax=Mercurialis annua TaxID=3986 RepID=UPI00215F50DE|nr:mitogen-activated protein kinase kinase kinase 20-like [Mercurialis annua]
MKRKLFDLNTIMEEEEEEEEIQFGSVCNNGVSWLRGSLLGKGGFGSVYIAKLKKLDLNTMYRPIMAVKSAGGCDSSSLQKEKEIYDNLNDCPYILQCFGEETTTDQYGNMFYNILLEYASGGTLDSLIKQSGGCGLPESDVKRYTRFILKGIDYIHSHGYVHCDLKPENVLLGSNDGSVDGKFVPKIGDFGLAKKIVRNRKFGDSDIGGTALYMAPETVTDGIQETPSDIWSLGCIVFEMLTGHNVWDSSDAASTDEILEKIGDFCELPEIPSHISKDAKDFLKACLVKKPAFRFTAEMLLDHQFLSVLGDDYERYKPEEEVSRNSVESLHDSDCEELCISSFSDGHEMYESEDEESANSVHTLYDSGCSELFFSSFIDDHEIHESEDEESTNAVDTFCDADIEESKNSVVRLCDSDMLGNYNNADLLFAALIYRSCLTGIAS